MITLNVIDDVISGSYGDKNFSVNYTEDLYKSMMILKGMADDAVSMAEYKDILEQFSKLAVQDYTQTVETECEYIHVNKATGQFFLKQNGVVSSYPMPQALVYRIFESIDKGLSFLPLVKMWTRWLRNPILRKKGVDADFSERFFNFVNLKYVKIFLLQDHLL